MYFILLRCIEVLVRRSRFLFHFSGFFFGGRVVVVIRADGTCAFRKFTPSPRKQTFV